MPQCQKCSSKFPNTLKIDNQTRNLSNRKYCLDCSPFKSRGVGWSLSYKTKNGIVGQDSVCKVCDRNFIYSKKSGHQRTKCNSCVVHHTRKGIKQKCVDYKGGSCNVCGYDKCLAALSFHHIDPSTKEFGISGSTYTFKWSRIKLELDKCELLCHNCHAEKHAALAQMDSAPNL